ncbi:histidine-type phosphatase [Erwinia phyllosphaerae]|uniref:histidine-type phosphatase n=1 Tax=Erwinia phyllosphaerae TaxID=2853256 RepID=UPI001FF0743E|nr:histidine-type phosphatase [Erwinia phyllosphaerae]MBV4366013.1 histidine-type phosphatase [Erwinia phyllosphaerae]
MYKFALWSSGVLLSALSILVCPCAKAETQYVLEKVVEVSRHGVRPPSPDNRSAIEAGSARRWASWQTTDGYLTGHGYTAAWLKGRFERDGYLKAGLLRTGCPAKGDFYVRASPMQRTRATAQAIAEAAFPGCGVVVHSEEKDDPLFHYPPGRASKAEAAAHYQQALRALGGNVQEAQRRLWPQIAALKQVVCLPQQPCPAFSQRWQLTVWSNGTIGMQGLDTLAAMAETLRLEWSENKPLKEVAFGNVTSQSDLVKLLPLLSFKYDYTNDLPGVAKRGASLLMAQIHSALASGINIAPHPSSINSPPDVRWLFYVAHDINIAWLRTMLNFSWQQEDYPHGNIPPGGSLVFERWRLGDKRFIRIYFQAQSLTQLRQLTPLGPTNLPLLTELNFKGCAKTPVGTLCPYQTAMQRIAKNIDPSLRQPVAYPD